MRETMKKWPKIRSLHNVLRSVQKIKRFLPSEEELPDLSAVTFRSKVKLHGTNAGIQVRPDGRVLAQSRNRVISDDNYGFAKFVESIADQFTPRKEGGYTIFGEWCGPGVQKKVAASSLDRKIFAAFGMHIDGGWEIEPDVIDDLLPFHPDVHVIPWHSLSVTFDVLDKQSAGSAAVLVNEEVARVEQCDPFISEAFGVEGTGEGLVFYPEVPLSLGSAGPDVLWFKAKGEKHKVVKAKSAASADPEVAASVEEFVSLFVTENRCKQICSAMSDERDLSRRDTGAFIRALAADVRSESEAELEAAGLSWTQVRREVGNAARMWFLREF